MEFPLGSTWAPEGLFPEAEWLVLHLRDAQGRCCLSLEALHSIGNIRGASQHTSKSAGLKQKRWGLEPNGSWELGVDHVPEDVVGDL